MRSATPARRAHAAEKTVWDLRDAFAASGDVITAGRIVDLMREAKSTAPLPTAEPSLGRQFLDKLMRNPATQLQAAQ